LASKMAVMLAEMLDDMMAETMVVMKASVMVEM
jgi:hypothetical protein